MAGNNRSSNKYFKKAHEFVRTGQGTQYGRKTMRQEDAIRKNSESFYPVSTSRRKVSLAIQPKQQPVITLRSLSRHEYKIKSNQISRVYFQKSYIDFKIFLESLQGGENDLDTLDHSLNSYSLGLKVPHSLCNTSCTILHI